MNTPTPPTMPTPAPHAAVPPVAHPHAPAPTAATVPPVEVAVKNETRDINIVMADAEMLQGLATKIVGDVKNLKNHHTTAVAATTGNTVNVACNNSVAHAAPAHHAHSIEPKPVVHQPIKN
jgi:hypothetical protein